MALAAMSRPLAAQSREEPKLWTFDITPQIGYRTNMTFTESNMEAEVTPHEGVSPRLTFDASPSYSVAFGVRYNDEDVIEFRWARLDTQMRITAPAIVTFRQSVTIDQFHLDCSHEYVLQEWPAWVRPFIIGSVGVTHVSSTASSASFTRFSFGLGGGLKAFPFRKVGFKLQAQWVPLWVNPVVTAYCGVGCIIHFSGELVSQGEVTFGPIFRF
jgi:hypothetical protein